MRTGTGGVRKRTKGPRVLARETHEHGVQPLVSDFLHEVLDVRPGKTIERGIAERRVFCYDRRTRLAMEISEGSDRERQSTIRAQRLSGIWLSRLLELFPGFLGLRIVYNQTLSSVCVVDNRYALSRLCEPMSIG